MKIGIMTFWWSEDNYGQLLQCYALQKYLRNLGHDAFLIRYLPEKETNYSLKRFLSIFNPTKVIRYILKRKQYKLAREEQTDHPRHFEEFRSKYIVQSDRIYYSYNELKNNPPEADIFIVGSDQVWNFPNITMKGRINAYCLQFTSQKAKRIAYAASFGVDSLNENISNQIQSLIRTFSSVGVREISGKEICNKMGINANVVCDPTLLLEKSQWTQIKTKVDGIRKKYIFLYLLKNTCSFSVKKLKNWANLNNLDLVYVSGNNAYYDTDFDDKDINKSYLTINQWLFYLSEAEYVITNSFHCCVFSLIFNKKVAVVPLTSSLKRTNDRINSLFMNLDAHKTEIVNNDFSVLEKCNQQTINTTFIEKSKRLLDSYLN